MADALKQETGFTENTKVADKNGNVFTVPSGFKIAKPTTENAIVYADANNPTVQDGIVIEDASNGNQFVWIPVGDIKNGEGVADTTIALERRTFNSANEEGKCTVKDHTADGTVLDIYYIEQTHEEQNQDGENYENAIAKDIAEFKQSVSDNGGYYIARFEASNSSGTVKSVKGADPWVSMGQTVASTNCQNMYVYDSSTKKYQSDLVNSYAWDTAIYFIQECSTEKAYAMKKGTDINTSKTKTGANSDRPCNICDMAGNVWEYSTETSVDADEGDYYPYTGRGGGYDSGFYGYASLRGNKIWAELIGFRPLLYIK